MVRKVSEKHLDKRLKNKGGDWVINPPSCKELYPNMSNRLDYPWHGVKKEIANKVKDCFQLKHNQFFNAMSLDLSELYYWGRLYDLYIDGRSKVR